MYSVFKYCMSIYFNNYELTKKVFDHFFQGAVRFSLITIHWIRIIKLVKSPLAQNLVKERTPGLFGTVSI